MPGSSLSGSKSFKEAACFMTFSPVSSSPQICSTFTMVWAAA